MSNLSERTLFSMVAYNDEDAIRVWKWRAQAGRESNRRAAFLWLESIAPRRGHCVIEAAITTLHIARKAAGRDNGKQILLLYNMRPFCGFVPYGNVEAYAQEALETITIANRTRIPINTQLVAMSPQTLLMGSEFGEKLAEMNNGKFSKRVIGQD